MTTRISASVIANNAITSALIANNSISPYQLTTGAPTWTANNNLYVAGTIKVSTVSSNTITSPGTLVLQTGALSNTALTIDTSQAVGIGGPPSTGTTGLSIFGTNQVNNSLGQLCLITTSNAAIDFGGQIVLGGNYSGNTNAYWFGNIAGRKENSVDGSVSGYLALSTTTSSGVSTEAMRITSAQNVGIGTSNPTSLLTVGSSSIRGAVNIIGTSSGTPSIVLDNTNASGGHNWGLYAGYTSAATFDIVDYFGSTRLTIDGSGNLGLGVTPSGWTGGPAEQFKYGGSVWNNNDSTFHITENAFYNGSWNYINGTSSAASNYYQSAGAHYWRYAGAGTGSLSWTTVMTLNGTGQLLVGTTVTSTAAKLVLNTPIDIHVDDSTTISSTMNAGNTNNMIAIRAPFNSNPGSTSGVNAKWGILFTGGPPSDTTNYPFTSTQVTTTAISKAAAIYAVSEDTLGYNRQVGMAFYTSAQDTNQTERVRITNAGYLGIGTNSPGYNFVNYAQTAQLTAATSNYGYGTVNITNSSAIVNNSTVDVLLMRNANGSVMNGSYAGHVYIVIQGTGGTNDYSAVYYLNNCSNGSPNATFGILGTAATRGTSPVSSVNMVSDGSGGAVKIQVTYINNAGVTTGICWASFVGIAW